MFSRVAIFMLAAMLYVLPAIAQNSTEKFDFKFGKVSAQDFQLPADAQHQDAAAYIIADIGFTEFRGNNKGWFLLEFERKVRIKILKPDGVDAADFAIPLYHQGSASEKLVGLKAASYNLEGDKIIETPLKSDQVFTDKLSRNVDLRKFSVPGAKVGAIVEVKYTIESDYISNLQPWEFQGKYPRYWSQYDVAMPEFFNYITLAQGYNSFYQRTAEQTRQNFNVLVPSDGTYASRSETFTLQSNVVFNHWVMKNVPALKEEAFTSSINNHISKIEFQLNQYRFPDMPPEDLMAKWPKVVETMNNDPEFGADLYRNNNFLDDELKQVLAGASTPEEKARLIYRHVQQKYTCTRSSGLYMTSNLKGVQKAKSGNVADINLLLVAMLNHEQLKAVPVILSTRSHGWTHDFYPLMTRFNYVVAMLEMDGKRIYLDATERGMPFGMLPAKCYNGHARAITGPSLPVYFMADSVSEARTTTNYLYKNEKGEWAGKMSFLLGAFESNYWKDYAREKGDGTVKDEMAKWIPAEYTLEKHMLKNLDSTDRNIVVDFEVKPQLENDADVIYLSPIVSRATTENPFQAAERKYPIEMPYTFNEVYVANIEIPEGYEIDELPKGAKVTFNEDGVFEYLTGVQNNMIMLRSKLQFKRANFPAEEYESLREFYTYVIKKQKENIVLKKKAKS